MAFTRTPGGNLKKWRFYPMPLVWVEGETDFCFYRPIADKIPHRFESLGGRKNAEPLIQALRNHNYPYLVILDGDYEILRHSRAPYHSVIILSRYSFENFLWDTATVNYVCRVHARCGDQ